MSNVSLLTAETLEQVSCVYALTHTKTGEQYIGSSKNLRQRALRHRHELRGQRHCAKRLQDAVDRDGLGSIAVEIIEMVADVSMLPQREEHHIATCKPAFNTSPSGGSPRTRIPSEQTRALIGARLRGQKKSPGACANMGAARVGQKRTPEQRERMRVAHLGQKHTPEQSAKKSATMRARWADPAYRARLVESHRKSASESEVAG